MTGPTRFALAGLALLAGCGAFVVSLPVIQSDGADLGAPDSAALAADALAAPDAGAEDLAGSDAAADLAGADLIVQVLLEFQYCWGSIPGDSFANCPTDTVPLLPDGTFSSGGGSGHWALLNNDTELYMDVDNSTITYHATRMQDGCYEGTMSNNLPVGPTGIFRACFR